MTTKQLPKRRNAAKAEILKFIDTKVERRRDGFIPSYLLPGLFTATSGLNVPAKKFFRIVRASGLPLQLSRDGLFFENIAFKEE